MTRIAALVACAAVACGGTPRRDAPGREPPRLVVLVVIDQLPRWAFDAKRPHLAGGFARLLGMGRLFTGEYPSAATVTAAGHATLGTGASPNVTGILGNDWYRRDAGAELGAVDDGAGGWTRASLRAPALADALAAGAPTAKAVGIALKPRAALLPLGQAAGLAVWYDPTAPTWKTSAPSPPAWVDALVADHPIAPRLDDVWTAADPAALARESGGADDAPGELGTHGLGATFPHDLAASDLPAKALVATPLGNELVLEAALAALPGEELGADGVPDLLTVSFSAHDYIGHAWGQESWEAWDAAHRLDAQLARLVDALDDHVGAERWAMILTSDHGAAPLPERTGGARHAYGEIAAVAEAAAQTVAGAGDWIAAVRYPTLYLSVRARELPAEIRDRMLDAIVAALRERAWLHRVERVDRIAGDCPARPPEDERLCLALDAITSGEVAFTPARFVILHEDDEATATHHGSLAAYDYQVPIVVVGPGAPPGEAAEPVSMLRVAPTLARWLGVAPPAQATQPPL
jgi:predicted AlkP superfamily pyrophosphatase or phosphodiesterase